MSDLDELYLDGLDQGEEGLTASLNAAGCATITVERGDDYGDRPATVRCTATLSREQMVELRDWLSAHLAAPTEGASA